MKIPLTKPITQAFPDDNHEKIVLKGIISSADDTWCLDLVELTASTRPNTESRYEGNSACEIRTK